MLIKVNVCRQGLGFCLLSFFMRRRRISLALMALTIGTIVAFQLFWLHKTYLEERNFFTIRTNALFRGEVLRLQAMKFHLDSVDLKVQDKSGMVTISEVLKNSINDSSGPSGGPHRIMMLSMKNGERREEADSAVSMLSRKMNKKMFDLVTSLDSLQDSVTVKEVDSAYHSVLKKEGVPVGFVIRSYEAVRKPASEFSEFPDPTDNQVRTGLLRPVIFELDFRGVSWYLFKKMSLPIGFSLVLIGVTIFSLTLLYRNWQRQRRLTELKNDFISNITHELKTPIATVSVAVEALRKFNVMQDPVRSKEYLDISADELQRLSLLVDKVLKLSLFERQEIELKNDYFDLKTLVDEVMASMRLQFEKYGARVVLTTEGPGIDFHLRADKLHITSVVFNLLDNALKYSRSHPSILIDLKTEPENLVLTVKDNGLGIPAEYKDKIFEKFFRVPTGDRHNVKGYGMGLSYVFYVLKRQGGTITVDSEEAIGSRFTVKIPRNHV
jgi:two-component system, OmpR family, phosphate regulon sensor histidine kinase PhoR